METISSPLTYSLSKPPLLSSSNSTFLSCIQLKTRQQQQQTSLAIKPRKRFSCNGLFGLGVPELVVIAGVVALVFGPKKLPEVGRSIGKTVKSFQEAAKEFESELKKDFDSPVKSQGEQLTAVSQEKTEDANASSSDKSVRE